MIELVRGKLSNYTGQLKKKENSATTKEEKLDSHFVNVDKDIQNLRLDVNKMIRYFRGYSFNDINIGSMGLGKSTSAPGSAVISSTSIEVLTFDGAGTTEQVYGCIELMHGYKEGTNLHPHIHWMPTTANTGNVKWQFEYSITQQSGSAIVSSTTIAVSTSATGTAWKEIVVDFPQISGTNLTIGNQLAFRLFRIPTGVDTYADDAALLTVGIHYEQDSLGSNEEYSKT